MKIITLGIALSLLIGSTALEAEGHFRKIYQEDGEKACENTINYLQTKMVETHKLNDMAGEEGQFQWDLYLFKKFVKASFLVPYVGAESDLPEAHYGLFRQSILFRLRSSDPSFVFGENVPIHVNANQFIAPLKNIKNILTPEAIEDWVKDSRNPVATQEVKAKELLAKSHIIHAWHEWTKKSLKEKDL